MKFKLVKEIKRNSSLIGKGKISYEKFVDWAKQEADKITTKKEKYLDLEFQWAETQTKYVRNIKSNESVKVIVYKDNLAVGYIGLENFKDGHKVSTLGVKEQVRGMGIATKMYDYVISKTKLYSDVMQTPEARKLWLKLSQKYKVQGFNLKDNIYFGIEDKGNELISTNPKYELYSDKKYKNYLVVLSK